MRILVLHQYFLMPGAGGGSRFNEFSKRWVAWGHDVTVIAGSLCYHTGVVPEPYRGRWLTTEDAGGAKVLRCLVPPTYAKSFVGRLWANGVFNVAATAAIWAAPPPDVVIATSPPLALAAVGWIAARLRNGRKPWVFEVRDLMPDSIVAIKGLSRRHPAIALLYWLERFACRSAARVNVLTPAFADDLVDRGLLARDKVFFVSNGVDPDLFKPEPPSAELRRQYGWGDRTVFLYAGSHGEAKGLDQLLAAADRLRARADIQIAFVGDGPERRRLMAQAEAQRLSNVTFIGAQPKERMPAFINACDVGLAVLQNRRLFHTIYPNKVFDYFACARPALVAIDGVSRRLVCDEARAGMFAEPENPADLARVICDLAGKPAERAEMGRRGREWVLQHATFDALARRYLDVLELACAERCRHDASTGSMRI